MFKDISSHLPIMVLAISVGLFFFPCVIVPPLHLSESLSLHSSLSIPPLHDIPCFNEVVDGSVHLFLLDEVVSPGLLQFHHLGREGKASQFHRYRKQEGETLYQIHLLYAYNQQYTANTHQALY